MTEFWNQLLRYIDRCRHSTTKDVDSKTKIQKPSSRNFTETVVDKQQHSKRSECLHLVASEWTEADPAKGIFYTGQLQDNHTTLLGSSVKSQYSRLLHFKVGCNSVSETGGESGGERGTPGT